MANDSMLVRRPAIIALAAVAVVFLAVGLLMETGLLGELYTNQAE